MALDPIIARGYQGQIGNALQDARRNQRTNTLLDLRAQQMQGEIDDDAEWDQAFANRDIDTMMKLDPQATQTLVQHWQGQKMAGLEEIPISRQPIDMKPLQAQENWAANFSAQRKQNATQNSFEAQRLGIQRAQEARLAGQEKAPAMAPSGYRWKNDGNLEPIPGGPSDTTVAKAGNQAAWNTYEAAIGGVKSAMAATVTGPIAGRFPAFSSNQQAADGAVAAIAPVLKQLFRTAGEGTFTDKDQQLLLAMVPTRADRPDARNAKIANIDRIVRAKLGIAADAPPESSGGSLSPDEQAELDALRKQFGRK